MTADLVAFLRARLDEDEGLARAARHEQARYLTPGYLGRPLDPDESAAMWDAGGDEDDGGNFTRGVWAGAGDVLVVWLRADRDVSTAEHIARHDPSRVLAEVTAKRAILDRLVHEGVWSLRHGVEGDEIVTYYWSTCSCGWEQEVYRNGDIEDAHDRHRDSAGYDEQVAADVVRLLAQPYAGHPAFHPSWSTT